MKFIDMIVGWVLGYAVFVGLILFSCYVYLHWVAPWSVIYYMGLVLYLIKFIDHYTDPMNIGKGVVVHEEKTESELEDEEFQRREDEYNDRRGKPMDDPDYDSKMFWRKS